MATGTKIYVPSSALYLVHLVAAAWPAAALACMAVICVMYYYYYCYYYYYYYYYKTKTKKYIKNRQENEHQRKTRNSLVSSVTVVS